MTQFLVHDLSTALRCFVEKFSEPTIMNDIAPRLTDSEVEAFSELLRVGGAGDAAEEWLNVQCLAIDNGEGVTGFDENDPADPTALLAARADRLGFALIPKRIETGTDPEAMLTSIAEAQAELDRLDDEYFANEANTSSSAVTAKFEENRDAPQQQLDAAMSQLVHHLASGGRLPRDWIAAPHDSGEQLSSPSGRDIGQQGPVAEAAEISKS